MNTLDEWLTTVTAELGIDPALVDRDAVLDLARDVAHHVARPAAPLTAFLVGLAAAGGDADGVRRVAERVGALAVSWGDTP